MKNLILIIKFINIHWFFRCLKNYALFTGRASRKEYWFFMLYWAIFYFILIFMENILGLNNFDFSGFSFSQYIPLLQISNKIGILTLLYRPLTLLPSLSVAIRRLHDRNISGWWSILFITPLGLLLIIPLIKRGNHNSNKYGSVPMDTAFSTNPI